MSTTLEELYKQRSALNEQIALAQEEAVKNGETIVIDGQTIDATMNYEGELGDPLLTDRIPLFRKDANADIVESGEIVIQDFFDKFGADAAGKIAQFNENAEEKTTAFNSNAESKVADFNANATEKKSAFDSNAESKVAAFNSNATDKTNTFNENSSNKQSAFDSNATAKTNAFNQNATSKEAELEDALDEYTTAKKGELDTYTNDKKSDFDSNATAKTTAFNENAEEKIEQVTEIADEVVNANIQNALTQLTALVQQMQSVPQTAHYLPVQVESTLYALSLSEDATGIYVELNEIEEEEEEVGGETA